MKVKIISRRCIACGLCQTYSPIFDYDDEGIVKFSHETANPSVRDLPSDPDLIRAVKECPTKALEID